MTAQNEATSGFDQSVDLLIIGSGAGAMTAGCVVADAGAEALLIEKGKQFGGSSAMSGGGLWVPCNHLAKAAGVEDDMDTAWTYLRGCVGEDVPEERLRAYLEIGPRLVKYLCEKTRSDFVVLDEYADYYPRVTGSKPGGRSLDPASFDGRVLGDELLNMRASATQQLIMGRISMTIPEARVSLSRTPGWMGVIGRLFMRYLFDIPWRFKSKRDRFLAMGGALVGALRASLMDRDVPVWLDSPCRKLIVEDGRVVGAEVERHGRTLRIGARKGVLLAAGGFEANQAMREKYLPKPTDERWSSANPNNTGDIIQMGIELGAALDFMDEAWWGPAMIFPENDRAHFAVIELSLPGSVFVNKKGERFVNEASPYGDKVQAMYAKNNADAETVPSYLVFDSDFRKKYPIGPMLPGAQQPDFMVKKSVRDQFVKADTLRELAGKLGIDADGLEATVARMNEYAKTGKDVDFGRGDTVFDRYYGDTAVTPNPNLGPIAKAPFYGIKCYPGELGTKGGLVTNERAQVLKEDGSVIPGLYAAGNCSAAVMGRSYPGAGATLGPATTFSFIAAHDALGEKLD